MAVVPRTLTLTEISGGQTGSGAIDTINANFAETAQAFNSLAEALSNRNAIVRHCVPVAGDVGVGDLVYWSSGCYCKAQALLEARPGLQGQSIEAECAHVDGIVIEMTTGATDTEATCNLLCGGCWSDSDVVSGFLGAGVAAEAGVYYLSPESAGKVTKDPGGGLRQPILTLYDNTTFGLGLFYMAHDNHFHATYTVPEWSGSANNWSASIPIESGAVGEMSEKVTAIFSGGVLVAPASDFSFGDVDTPVSGAQQIIYSGATDPGANNVVLFNHYPFAYGSPVVRLVQTTDSSSLTVKTVNGIVTLTPNDFVVASGAATGTAIGAISGGTIYTTPVIASITGSGGVTAVTSGGSTTIALADVIGNPIDPDIVNHNGTAMVQVQTGNAYMQCITFLTSRTANVSIQKALTGIPTGTTAYVCGSLVGAGNDTFTVNLSYIPQPETTPVATTSIISATTSMTVAGAANSISYAQTSGGLTNVSGNGVLTANIAINGTPAADRQFLRLGFILTN